ncbi:hypothetical protein IW152_005582, partial [Coemansia sp. BCRC 34962]
MDVANAKARLTQPAVRRTVTQQQPHRRAPYARPTANSQRSNSFADRVLGICKQISKPLFARGSTLGSLDDAFVAPWRTVDRETYELREELLKAQREAAAFDQRQLKQEEATAAKAPADIAVDDTAKATDIEGTMASASSVPVAPVGQSSYESVFATARKLAERRATDIVVAEEASSKGKEPDRSLSVATFDDDDEDEDEDEDEEDDNDFEPRDAEDEDDEEEVLQLDMEPIDEAEEVTSPAASANEQSSIATSSAASPSNSQAIAPARLSPSPESELASELSVATDASDQSIELSVVEESSGDELDSTSESDQDQTQEDKEDEVALPAYIEEPVESEATEESEPESEQVEVVVEDLDEDEEGSADLGDQDVLEETDEVGVSSVGDASDVGSSEGDSDQMTEEITTMSSEENEGAFEAEAEAEPEVSVSEAVETETEESTTESTDSVAAVSAGESAPLFSPRSWWPFGGRSLLSGLGSAQKGHPRERPQAVHEAASESDDSSRMKPTKRKPEEQLAVDDSRAQACLAPLYQGPPTFAKRRLFQRPAYGRNASPYVPLSFIDVSNNGAADALGKRVRGTEHSGLRNSATAANRRHTSNAIEPAATPSELSKVAASYEPLSTTPKRAKTATATPAITAASLGLEARRSVARGRCQQLRKLTSVYYGSGYGSHSVPYTLNVSLSAPKAISTAESTQTVSAQAANPVGDVAGPRGGSITAQTILDIISEVPPICSLASMDSRDIINPYELSSPYSVRMCPATAQRRRVLVPLSTRLSQSSATVSTKAAAQHTDNSSSTRAVIESIQSAAPPEVQAGLGSALKAIQPNRQTQKRFLPPPLPTKKPTTVPSPSVNKSAGAAVVPSQSPGVASPSSLTKTLSSTSPSSLAARLAAKGLPAPKPLDQLAKDSAAESASLAPKQALSFDAPKSLPKATGVEDKASTPPPLPAKALFSTPPPTLAAKPVEVPPPKAPETVAAPAARQMPNATTTALATSELQLPVFSFALPAMSESVGSAAAKQKAKSLGASQLPAFAFTLDVKAMPAKGLSQLSSRVAPPLAQAKTGEWTCDVCDLKSPLSATQCIVCDAARPTSKAAAAPSVPPTANLWANSGLNPVAPADGKWTCDTCELKNPSSASKCTVCDAAKPGPALLSSTAMAATTAAPVPNLWAQSGLNITGTANGEWTCDICELKNPSSASKCTVCDAAKPGPALLTSTAVAVATAAPVPNLWAQSGLNITGTAN